MKQISYYPFLSMCFSQRVKAKQLVFDCVHKYGHSVLLISQNIIIMHNKARSKIQTERTGHMRPYCMRACALSAVFSNVHICFCRLLYTITWVLVVYSHARG